MATMLLRGATALLDDTLRFESRPLDILIDGHRIAAIEPSGAIPGADQVIDLTGRIVVPGMINCHLHSHEHFQRGRTENLPLELWMHYVRPPLPVLLNTRQVYLRTLIGAIECLRSGATAVIDDLTLGTAVNREHVDAALKAYEDVGIRALVGFAMMNRPVVDNFPFAETAFDAETLERLRNIPRPTPESLDALMQDLVAARHPAGSRVGVLVSCSAPQRCTAEFLLHWRRFADDHDLPVITHVQETRMQVVTGQKFYGAPQVEYLARIGFLKPKTSLIHAVWLNPREIELLARCGTTAQHNPWSNLLLGSGVAPVRALLDAGVNVSMGSDGSCSTVTVNMLNVTGAAAALSKVRGDDYTRWLSAKEAYVAATQGGARSIGFDGKLGVITQGAIADLVAYRTNTIGFTPLSDPLRQLVYGERGSSLDLALVAGNVVIRDGTFKTIDERAILAEIDAEFAALRAQFERSEASVTPMLQAMEGIFRRCLGEPIAPDTFPARLP
jgi:guanine deaminase